MSIPPGVFLALREPEDARFYPSVIPVQSFAPPISARVWLDDSTQPAQFKAWNGAAWVAIDGTSVAEPAIALDTDGVPYIDALGFPSTGSNDASVAAAIGSGTTTDTALSSYIVDEIGTPSATRTALETHGDARWQRDLDLINVMQYGAVGNGITDDLTAFQDAATAARAARATLYVPRGTYYLNGTVDISGLTIRGEHSGYLGKSGTIIKGNGTGVTFNQAQTNTDNNRMGLHGLRFTDCATAIRMSYTVHSHLSDIAVVDATSTGIILGDNAIIGPLWNHFERVRVSVTGSSPALLLAGLDWCNANMFTDCDFKGSATGPAVRIQSSGGFGAVANTFFGTEMRGANVGLELLGTNRATSMSACYFESDGPSVWIGATSSSLALKDCVFAALTNTNPTGKPNFVHHASAGASVSIDGGWISVPVGTQYDNLRLVDTAVGSPDLAVWFPSQPNRRSVLAAGFRIAGSTVPVESGLIKEIRATDLTAATTLGSVSKRIAVVDEFGVLIGYVPVYNTIT